MQNDFNNIEKEQDELQDKQQNKQQKQQIGIKKDYKNVMIVALLIAVCFMSVSYAVLSSKQQGNKIVTFISSDTSDIRISTISSVITKGDGMDIKSFISDKTEVTLYPSVASEEDEVTYTINVVNNGNKAVSLESIDIRGKNDAHLSYSINNINAGDILYAQESRMFTITVKYNDKSTDNIEYDEDKMSEVILSLNYE